MNRNATTPRRRLRLPWVLLGLMVAIIAGVTAYRHLGQAEKPSVSGSDIASGTAPESPIRRLTPDDMRALAARSPGSPAPTTARDMAEMMKKRKLMTEASQAQVRKRTAEMSSRFAAEKTDPKWSVAHAQELDSLQDSGQMRDAGAKVENFRADCRATMCRIQGDFPSATMASDWIQLYMASVGNRLPMATAHQVRNPDGSVRVEIYGVGRK